jgi:Sec-independent protein translocase protein TatA
MKLLPDNGEVKGGLILNIILAVLVVVLSVYVMNLRGTIKDLSSQLSSTQSKATEVQAALENTKSKAAQAQVALENTKAKLNQELAKKPAMPVVISFRKAMTGPGMVGQFVNRSGKELIVVIELKNPTTKSQLTKNVDLTPERVNEIGFGEGWPFASGDLIKITHNDFEQMIYIVP